MNKTILVPIDYSDVTDALIDEASRLAKAFDAVLHLVHVAANDTTIYSSYQGGMGMAYPRQDQGEMLQEASEQLTAAAETCRRHVQTVTTSLLEGSAGSEIMEEARKIRPMMIVLGSHGHGALHHLLAGSVCEYVMKHSVCPITIVPSRVGTYEIDLGAIETVSTV